MSGLRARVRELFAEPNPIVLKELRATFRSTRFVRFLYLSTAVIAFGVLAIGAMIASGSAPPAEVGAIIFQVFLGGSLVVLCLIAPGYAASAITSEREQFTWESLELSGLSPLRIVLGKYVACFASIALVLVAFTPAVGVAFLFGGVSPGEVFVGFLSLLLVLALAVGFGIAISARLNSSRIAIVLASLGFLPFAITGAVVMTYFGDEARSHWGLSIDGPFFYTQAFVTRGDELDTWLYLVGGPLYAFGMPLWLCLALAVGGVKPASADRSRALKAWAIAMTATTTVAWFVLARSDDFGGEQPLFGALSGIVLALLYAILFVGESILPPRPWELAVAERPLPSRFPAAFGPSAAGDLRFVLLLIGATIAGMTSAAVLAHEPASGPHLVPRVVPAAIALAVGGACVAWFTASLGAWLRVVALPPIGARLLAFGIVIALAVVPLLIAAILEPRSIDRMDDDTPSVMLVSTLHPILVSAKIVGPRHSAEGYLTLLFTIVPYGGAALAGWIAVEIAVRRARFVARERRKRFDDAMERPA